MSENAPRDSLAAVIGRPRLLGPSPEISMTRRLPANPLAVNIGAMKSMTVEIEVRDSLSTGDSPIFPAKARAEAAS